MRFNFHFLKSVAKRLYNKPMNTKQKILLAFQEMICDNKSTKINVTTITDKVGIHRKTFYLHFSCIEDLYEEAITLLADEYSNEVKKLNLPFNYYDLTKVFFDFCSNNEYAEKLYCNPAYSDLCSKLNIKTIQNNRNLNNPYSHYSPEMQNIINAFVTNASIIAYRQWVLDGKRVKKEDAIHMVSTLLETGVSSITDNSLAPYTKP